MATLQFYNTAPAGKRVFEYFTQVDNNQIVVLPPFIPGTPNVGAAAAPFGLEGSDLGGAYFGIRNGPIFIATAIQVSEVFLIGGVGLVPPDLVSFHEGGYATTASIFAGADVIGGGANHDFLDGFAGNDVILGQAGNDIADGGSGNDLMYGGAGSDRLYGGLDNDFLDGGLDVDFLYGRAGNDRYVVDSRLDRVAEGVGGGSDTVYATVNYAFSPSAQVEVLRCLNPAATNGFNLKGSSIANYLVGDAGSNVLNGRGGADKLRGLDGEDFFVFDVKPTARTVDRALDFDPEDDTIQLENGIFKGIGASLSADEFRVVTGGRQISVDASDRLIYNKSTGALWYDADGTGPSQAVKVALLPKHLSLTLSDIDII